MTNGPDTFWAGLLATIAGCWLVRVTGEFIAGYALRFTRRFDERIKEYRDDA